MRVLAALLVALLAMMWGARVHYRMWPFEDAGFDREAVRLAKSLRHFSEAFFSDFEVAKLEARDRWLLAVGHGTATQRFVLSRLTVCNESLAPLAMLCTAAERRAALRCESALRSVAAAVEAVDYSPRDGRAPELLLQPWLTNGQRLGKKEVLDEEKLLDRVAKLLHEVHLTARLEAPGARASSPAEGRPHELDPMRIIDARVAFLRESGVALPPNSDAALAELRPMVALLERLRRCHFEMDKHFRPESVLARTYSFPVLGRVAPDSLTWLYARPRVERWHSCGVGNRWADLASYAALHDFSPKDDRELISRYYLAEEELVGTRVFTSAPFNDTVELGRHQSLKAVAFWLEGTHALVRHVLEPGAPPPPWSSENSLLAHGEKYLRRHVDYAQHLRKWTSVMQAFVDTCVAAFPAASIEAERVGKM
jgi:hypothetical protein